jgi:predicted DNA-binding protein
MSDPTDTSAGAANAVDGVEVGYGPGQPENGDVMTGLRFGEDGELPPAADVDDDDEPMVVRSLRMPLELDRRLKAAAAARGLPVSQLVRDWVELELAALENDQPISRADALRALAAVRPLGAA